MVVWADWMGEQCFDMWAENSGSWSFYFGQLKGKHTAGGSMSLCVLEGEK